MPITLPSLSRRRLFVEAFAAACAVASVRIHRSLAQDPSAPESWVLFSDTHIPADRELSVRGVKCVESFKTCVSAALEWQKNPSGVLVCGDCAHKTGELADYEVFADVVRPLRGAGAPVHLLLGNHDDREHFMEVLGKERNVPSPVEQRHVALVEGDHANWFLLDSLEKVNSTPGLLGSGQLGWLEKALDSHGDKPAIVMLHHDIPAGSGKLGLQDHAELLGILRPRKQVKACFYGHTHAWGVRRDESGIHLINLPSVAAAFWPMNPRGWVRADLRRDSLKLELRCVDVAHPKHGEVHELEWRS
ncbi:MAG: metallophosphoesterase [Verrucomicrobiota bacterium]